MFIRLGLVARSAESKDAEPLVPRHSPHIQGFRVNGLRIRSAGQFQVVDQTCGQHPALVDEGSVAGPSLGSVHLR